MNPSAEAVERMLEAARYGAQALDSAAKRAAAEAAREAEKAAAGIVESKEVTEEDTLLSSLLKVTDGMFATIDWDGLLIVRFSPLCTLYT